VATRNHIPDGWRAVTPRIVVEDAEGLVRFVKQVFGAKGEFLPERPTELSIDDSLVMVSTPIEREVMPGFLYVYVEDTDATFERAKAKGATVIEEPGDMPYGDRRAMVRDAWGNLWQIATHGGQFTP